MNITEWNSITTDMALIETNGSKGAELSICRCYRYSLWRLWDTSKPSVLFIGLNPSTADEYEDDPTLSKCMQYAANWEYGGVYMANLFAFRATQPRDLFKADEPIGNKNDDWIRRLNNKAAITVAAWGNHGMFMGRSSAIKPQLKNLYFLRLNKTGEPAHPLYLRSNFKPFQF